jgi:hypothetical protein
MSSKNGGSGIFNSTGDNDKFGNLSNAPIIRQIPSNFRERGNNSENLICPMTSLIHKSKYTCSTSNGRKSSSSRGEKNQNPSK